mgnify:CR=1 FL=1
MKSAPEIFHKINIRGGRTARAGGAKRGGERRGKGMMTQESLWKLTDLKQECEALLRREKQLKAWSVAAVVGFVISILAYASAGIRYDLIPIDRATFARYSLSTPIAEFVQADLANLEDAFTITTSANGVPPWTALYQYDSNDLTDSAAATYSGLKARYDISDSSSMCYELRHILNESGKAVDSINIETQLKF